MPVEKTEQFIRIRQRSPGDFQEGSFRTITISSSKGIKAVVGRLRGQTGTLIQTYLFDVKKWTIDRAKSWIRAHGGRIPE